MCKIVNCESAALAIEKSRAQSLSLSEYSIFFMSALHVRDLTCQRAILANVVSFFMICDVVARSHACSPRLAVESPVMARVQIAREQCWRMV